VKRTPLAAVIVLALGLTGPALAQGARGASGALRGEASGETLPLPEALVQPGEKEGGEGRADATRYRPPLAHAGERIAADPSQLTPETFAALVERSKERRSRWYAGPELLAALRAVEASGDPAFRDQAGKAARELELDAHMVELRRAAFQARAQGKRGVEIWSEVARRSVDYWQGRDDVDPKRKFDEVIADLGAVFNGQYSQGHLKTFQDRLPFTNDPNLRHMQQVLDPRKNNLGWVGGGIDPTQSQDFRGMFNDRTNNQVFHTNFFVLLGYAAAQEDPKWVNLVNLKHELLDGGGSVPDWNASEAGIATGHLIRQLRDSHGNERALRAIPTLIGAGFSNHAQDFARPWGPTGPDYGGVATAMDESMTTFANRPRTNTATQRGLIRLFNVFRGAGGEGSGNYYGLREKDGDH